MPAAGYFRGTGYCFGYHHGLSKCSRTWLSYLTAHKNQSHLVDSGGLSLMSHLALMNAS